VNQDIPKRKHAAAHATHTDRSEVSSVAQQLFHLHLQVAMATIELLHIIAQRFGTWKKVLI
jgi:hypothetical protein